ncbi:hypothetical protein H632_c475p0 [Helicosporidium sp. ATCC 50920]|nr:hypothetical protein H632_c475p0 [Helicosporidium sp. ATCC 50920]|eukprot:KDD75840.1 hypothetical protein H632_c475p0 [Helicosporidium sp. ATCC 50920]
MADAANYLVVTPSELKFRFEPRRNVPVQLTLQNPRGERIAFKVKTTSPRKYCVRPSNGIVEPNASREIQIILQSQRETPANLADCKDKFLIQCTRLSGADKDLKEVTSDLFDASKNGDIRQTKLRVTMINPPQPPSPVAEGVEEPASPGARGPRPSAGSGGRSLDEQMAAAAQDRAEISQRISGLHGARSGGALAQRPPWGGAYRVWHVVLVAILAFVLGRYLQR